MEGEGVSLSYTAGRGRQPPCWVASAVVTFNYSYIDRLADGPAKQPVFPLTLFSFLIPHVKVGASIHLSLIEIESKDSRRVWTGVFFCTPNFVLMIKHLVFNNDHGLSCIKI